MILYKTVNLSPNLSFSISTYVLTWSISAEKDIVSVGEIFNIKDENDTKDWKEESIKILEGGREAFEERGEIYGNNNS